MWIEILLGYVVGDKKYKQHTFEMCAVYIF